MRALDKVFASRTREAETIGGLSAQLGVEYRLHDLRHHHATALIEAGVHIKAVQTRLGHSSPSLTMAVYAHVSPAMDKEAAEAYGRAMSQ